MEKILKKIGLTDIEISIYLSLFHLGESTASKIAEKNKIHRTNAYDYMGLLIQKGLASKTIREGTQYFKATDPNNLLSYIDALKDELDDNKKNIHLLVKKLKEAQHDRGAPSRIETFNDRQGLKSFYETLISAVDRNDEILIIGTSERIEEVFDYYFLNLTKKIIGAKLKIRMIANEGIMKYKYMKLILKLININIRYVALDYLSPTATFIFKDYVGFCNFMENPFVILINDKAISNTYRNHFGTLWAGGRQGK